MGRISAAILGAIVAGSASAFGLVWFLSWGRSLPDGALSSPARSDYVDLMLTLVSVVLTATGLAVTVGALVIGLVALKTLREIKDEASSEARSAAAARIAETMNNQLEPSVAAKLEAALPIALQRELLDNDLGHRILSEMAQRGELDEVLERVASRMQGGGPEPDEDDQSEDE